MFTKMLQLIVDITINSYGIQKVDLNCYLL